MIDVRLGTYYSKRTIEIIMKALRSYNGPLVTSWESYVNDDNEISWRVFGETVLKRRSSAIECKAEIVQAINSYERSLFCRPGIDKLEARCVAAILAGDFETAKKTCFKYSELRGYPLNPLETACMRAMLNELKGSFYSGWRYVTMGVEIPEDVKNDPQTKDLMQRIETMRSGQSKKINYHETIP